jgi:murein DD-endopeptidase MepM/ murein hydrolase activator NlpD
VAKELLVLRKKILASCAALLLLGVIIGVGAGIFRGSPDPNTTWPPVGDEVGENAKPRTTAEIVAAAVEDLRARQLEVPVIGIARSLLVSNFDDDQGVGQKHEALDILAAQGTPVVAPEGGRIVRLLTTERAGVTIYQFDHSERYCYYYAHLGRYAAALVEGAIVVRGQTLGYVGTSGNAPPDQPHLHFAIHRLTRGKNWWDGTPIDPVAALSLR